jgi:N-acetylglucosamine-6-phosphate deacetylase
MSFIIQGDLLWPDGEIRPGVLLTNGRHIESLQPHLTAPPAPDDQLINVPAGGVAAPGYIDLQINGAFGHDFTTYPDLVIAAARYLPRFGITAFLPTLLSTPLERYQLAMIAIQNLSPEPEIARVLGLHLIGPYLNPAEAGAHNVPYLRRPSLQELAYLDPAVVCLFTLAPELPGALPLIHALVEKGIRVGLGHSNASYEQTLAAVEEGASWGSQLFNSMSPLHHRHPGLAGALLADDRLRLALIADGVHLHPAILRLAAAAKGPAGVTLISNAVSAAGMGKGEYTLGTQKVLVDNNAARLEGGTLAGSLIMLDQAVRNMVSLADWPLADVLQMASTTPAATLGLPHKGRLLPGHDADIVILDPTLHVTHTLIEGQLAYQSS